MKEHQKRGRKRREIGDGDTPKEKGKSKATTFKTQNTAKTPNCKYKQSNKSWTERTRKRTIYHARQNFNKTLH